MSEFKNLPSGWKVVRLGDVCDFYKGKGISKDDISENGISCIRYGELYTTYSERIDEIYSKTNLNPSELFLSKCNDIIIPCSGETAQDIAKASCVLLDGIALGGDLNVLRTRENGIFLSYYLNVIAKKDIAKIAQGVSIVHLYASELKNLKIKIPSVDEQKKIVEILSTWDEAINLTINLIESKKQFKKALMQNLLTAKIRFPQFKGEWKFTKLGNLLDYEQPTQYLVSDENYDNGFGTPVLTAGKTFILGYTNETKGIFQDNLPVIIFDDFTTATQFVNFPFKVKSSAMKILKQKNTMVNIRLVYEMMQMINFVASDHKRYWISEFQDLEIKLPNLNEQQKIAEVLTACDDEINLLNLKLENLKKQKQGLMQKLLKGEMRTCYVKKAM